MKNGCGLDLGSVEKILNWPSFKDVSTVTSTIHGLTYDRRPHPWNWYWILRIKSLFMGPNDGRTVHLWPVNWVSKFDSQYSTNNRTGRVVVQPTTRRLGSSFTDSENADLTVYGKLVVTFTPNMKLGKHGVTIKRTQSHLIW